jgi:hypothetical protein
LVLSFALMVSLSGCGVTLNPVKRKSVEIYPFGTRLSSNSENIVIGLEDALQGKPLSETVWDNVSGAFWDIEESKQIGFTQNYSKLVAATAGAGVVGGAIGGAVIGAAAGPKLVDTRIVIPFGRIFEGVMRSGLTSTFPNANICNDEQCESQMLQTRSPQYIVKMQVTSFKVWEAPLNHINLSATVVSKIRPVAQPDQPESVFEARKELTNQSIGSVMSTSSGFISEMNRISNKFTPGRCAGYPAHPPQIRT